MTNSSVLFFNLKTEASHLQEVRTKIEQFSVPGSGDKKRQPHLRACEDLLAVQLVITAMRYHSIVRREWQASVGRGYPDLDCWMKRTALAFKLNVRGV